MAAPGKSARAAGWVLVDNGSAALLAIATLIVMARILGPREFAAAALALVVVQLLMPLAEGFFHDAIVQRKGLGPKHIVSAWAASIGVGLILTLGSWVSAGWLSRIFEVPEIQTILPVLSVLFIIGGVSSVPMAFARRRGRYKALAVRTLIGRFVGSAVGISAALAGAGAWSVVAQQLSAAFSSVALLLISSNTPRRAGFSVGHLRALIAFSTASLGEMLVWAANTRIATLVVGGLLGPTAAAQWNVAQRLVEPLQALAGSAASHLALPLLARRQHDEAALGRGFKLATGMSSLLVLPIYAGLAACAPELVNLVLGKAWAEAAPLMAVFAGIAALASVRQFGPIAMAAVGRPAANLAVSFISCLAGLAGVVVGAYFGLWFAAIGAICRLIPGFAMGMRLIQRAVGIPVVDQLQPVAGPMMAAVVMVGAVFGLRFGLPDNLSDVSMLAIMTAFGVCVYLLAALIFAREQMKTAANALGFGGNRKGAGQGKRVAR